MKYVNIPGGFRQLTFIILIFTVLSAIFLPTASAESIQWSYSYDTSLKLAGKDNKPVMMFLYTMWCGYCRKMDAETFKDTSVLDASKDFVCVRIDAEKERKIAYSYGVGAFPTILFLDPSGRVIFRLYGFRDAPVLSKVMKEVLAFFKKGAQTQPYLKSAFDEAGRGNIDKAIAIIEDAIKIYRDDPSLYSARGALYLNKGDLDRALTDFDRSLSLNPGDDNVYTMRGIIYYKKRDFEKALADCNKAISINRWAYEAYNGLGVIYLESGDADLAIKNFNTVILINPQNAGAYYSRGLAYTSKGAFDKAVDDFTMALVLSPELLNAYSNRAYAYFMMKDYDKSWKDVNEVERRGYKMNPDFLEKLTKASGRNEQDKDYFKYESLFDLNKKR